MSKTEHSTQDDVEYRGRITSLVLLTTQFLIQARKTIGTLTAYDPHDWRSHTQTLFQVPLLVPLHIKETDACLSFSDSNTCWSLSDSRFFNRREKSEKQERFSLIHTVGMQQESK